MAVAIIISGDYCFRAGTYSNVPIAYYCYILFVRIVTVACGTATTARIVASPASGGMHLIVVVVVVVAAVRVSGTVVQVQYPRRPTSAEMAAADAAAVGMTQLANNSMYVIASDACMHAWLQIDQ